MRIEVMLAFTPTLVSILTSYCSHPLPLLRCCATLLLYTTRRQGQAVPERALQDVYRMFDRLGIYEELLEKPLLKHTEMFYQEEASNAVASMQLPEYLSLGTKRLTDERRRSTHYVPPSTFAVLEGVVYRVMVTAHLDFLLGPSSRLPLTRKTHRRLRGCFRSSKTLTQRCALRRLSRNLCRFAT